jgi:hypothetical protein
MKQYEKSLLTSVEMFPLGAIEILQGRVDTLSINYLDFGQKRHLFYYFIRNIKQLYNDANDKQKIIDNVVYIFIRMFKEHFYLKRTSDITPLDSINLLFILNNISKYKLIQNNYTDIEIHNFINYREKIMKISKLYGLYDDYAKLIPIINTNYCRRKNDYK